MKTIEYFDENKYKYYKTYFLFFMIFIFVGNHYITCKTLPLIQYPPKLQKFVTPHNFVIEQENIEKQDLTENQLETIDIKNNFTFTEYHKQNLNNVYINLSYQTECTNFTSYQCWSSKLEFENETIDNSYVAVDSIVTPNCRLILHNECTRKQGIKCFRMVCKDTLINKKYLDIYPVDRNSLHIMLPRNGIYFLLEKGNYHSSWQANSFLNPITLKSIKATQDVIKKFNYYEHFPNDELLLVFTTIHEKPNKYDNKAHWLGIKYIYIPKIKQYIPIHCIIETRLDLSKKIHLHERIHEYINRAILGPKTIKYRNMWVYTGDKTFKLVAKDVKFYKKLSKSIIFLPKNGSASNATVKDGRYGLIIQDRGHLGNWGPGAAPSSYSQVSFNIGKYTMSIINENGFYMT